MRLILIDEVTKNSYFLLYGIPVHHSNSKMTRMVTTAATVTVDETTRVAIHIEFW